MRKSQKKEPSASEADGPWSCTADALARAHPAIFGEERSKLGRSIRDRSPNDRAGVGDPFIVRQVVHNGDWGTVSQQQALGILCDAIVHLASTEGWELAAECTRFAAFRQPDEPVLFAQPFVVQGFPW